MENEEKKEELVAEIPQPQKALEPIAMDEKGRVVAKNNAELLRYCGAMIQSGAVPKWFDSPQKLFGGLMFVRSMGLPDVAIRQVANIHGVTSMFGDLPLALAQMSGELEDFCEQWFDADYKVICFENKNLTAEVWGAVCFMSRKKTGVQSFSFTLDDARKSGMYPAKSETMPWAKYTRLMLRYKARSIGIKSLFADKINGSAILEHDFETNDPQSRDVSPERELADELNKN